MENLGGANEEVTVELYWSSWLICGFAACFSLSSTCFSRNFKFNAPPTLPFSRERTGSILLGWEWMRSIVTGIAAAGQTFAVFSGVFPEFFEGQRWDVPMFKLWPVPMCKCDPPCTHGFCKGNLWKLTNYIQQQRIQPVTISITPLILLRVRLGTDPQPYAHKWLRLTLDTSRYCHAGISQKVDPPTPSLHAQVFENDGFEVKRRTSTCPLLRMSRWDVFPDVFPSLFLFSIEIHVILFVRSDPQKLAVLKRLSPLFTLLLSQVFTREYHSISLSLLVKHDVFLLKHQVKHQVFLVKHQVFLLKHLVFPTNHQIFFFFWQTSCFF